MSLKGSRGDAPWGDIIHVYKYEYVYTYTYIYIYMYVYLQKGVYKHRDTWPLYYRQQQDGEGGAPFLDHRHPS